MRNILILLAFCLSTSAAEFKLEPEAAKNFEIKKLKLGSGTSWIIPTSA